jgi:VanZ family protein
MPSAVIAFRRLVGPVLACYWLAMFAGTHWPRFELANYPENTDKVLHFSAYAGLGFLLAAYWSQKRTLGRWQFAGIFAIVVAYSIADELLQMPVGRDCDPLDALADAAGCIIGLLVFALAHRAIRRWGPYDGGPKSLGATR